jgi:hypothetical protein
MPKAMEQFLRVPRDERHLYFVQTAERLRLSPQIVEKDFWVCWTLRALFGLPSLGASLIFKGGTSLSKVYRIIERFSEDIDVSIDRASLGFGGDQDPAAAASAKERERRIDRLKAACQRTVVEKVRPALATVIAAACGEAGDWSLRLDEDDPDRQTLLFAYPARAAPTTQVYIRPVVRIELGSRSDHWPSEQAPITPYVAQAFPVAFRAPAVVVKVLAVIRTFWEKATLLHAEHHRPPTKAMPLRLSRHYYDLARLITAGVGEQAVANLELLQHVVAHKTVFFQSGWARYAEAQRGSLRLVPSPERTQALSIDYDSMREMFFGERLAFADVLRVLGEWETHFNLGA